MLEKTFKCEFCGENTALRFEGQEKGEYCLSCLNCGRFVNRGVNDPDQLHDLREDYPEVEENMKGKRYDFEVE